MNLISIIVPVYNMEKYLSRCLDSLIMQTYANLEIIVIDDGSKDNSKQIIQQYEQKDPRIIPIYQQNAGVSCARNAGLRIASGDFISFVDSDDYVALDMFERMIQAVDDQTDIIETVQYFTNENKTWYKPYQTSKKINNINLQEDKNSCVYITMAPHSRLYRKELIEDHYFPEGLVFEDNYFISTLFPKINYVKKLEVERGYYHYQRIGSTTLSFTDKIFDMIQIEKMIYNYFKNNNYLNDYYNVLEKNANRSLVISLLGRKMAFYKNKQKRKSEYKNIKTTVINLYPNYWENKNINWKEKLLSKFLLMNYFNCLIFWCLIRVVKKNES